MNERDDVIGRNDDLDRRIARELQRREIARAGLRRLRWRRLTGKLRPIRRSIRASLARLRLHWRNPIRNWPVTIVYVLAVLVLAAVVAVVTAGAADQPVKPSVTGCAQRQASDLRTYGHVDEQVTECRGLTDEQLVEAEQRAMQLP